MRSIVCAALLALAVTATGCSRLHAKAAPDSQPNPALNVPPPPPHDVETTETEAPPPVPLPQEPARNTPLRQRQPPPHEQPRTDAPRPEPPKPETPPVPPPEAAPKPEEPSRPAAPLQTMPTTAEGDMERQIRATVQRASADLNRIDYRALNKDARIQYDTAKRFLKQAEEAIKAKNLLFAKTVADKAATLAAQLSSR